MAKRILLVLILLAVAGGLIFAYVEMSKERQLEAGADRPLSGDSRIQTNEVGELVLKFDKETQARIQLKVEQLAAATMAPEVQGFARVLDPAPLAALAAELASAEAALVASQKEFDRLKLLSNQQNASEKAFQAAGAAARHDQIAVESVRSRLLSGWGKRIAEQPDLAGFIRPLISLDSAVVRVDVPAGNVITNFDALAHGIRIRLPSGKIIRSTEWLGPAANVDPQFQGQGFLFLVKADHGEPVPGAAMSAYLPLQAEPLNGYLIPDSAIVRQGGQGWIYVQNGDDTFARRKVSLDNPREDGWFIREGLKGSERVVTQGAQALLSEEFKNQIRMLD